MENSLPVNSTRPDVRRHGFTLVEVLAVVAIVGVLLAILLPVISRARGNAESIKCISNLRTIGMGFVIYASEHRGTMIPGRMPNLSNNIYWVGNGRVFRPRWYVTMGQAAGVFAFTSPPPNDTDGSNDNTRRVTNLAFLCPTEPERDNNRNFTYGYNFQFLGNVRNKVGTPSGQWRPIHFPVKFELIKPSDTVVAADALGTAAGKPSRERTPYRQNGSADLFAVGNHAWSLDPPRVTATSDYCDDNARAPQHRSAPDARHRGRANFLFADGHVETLTPQQAGYVLKPDGSFASGDGSDGHPRADNSLFSGKKADIDPPSIN